jgi:hypothetical protein
MSKCLRITIAAGLMAASLTATAQQDARPGGFDDNNLGNCGAAGFLQRFTLRVVGLTSDQRLVCFNEYLPRNARTIGSVSGLSGGDTSLVGIDYRVQDGKLYGVGNAGGVYILDTSNAAATFVNRLSIPLSGTRFGVDFNAAADRLRIISDTGQNLRHNVNAAGVTVADGALNYTVGTTALGVTGAAYTNNDLGAPTATTLYALDSSLDQIAIQSPPNNGSLVATGRLTIDTGDWTGFDIYSIVRDDVTVDVLGFASLFTADGKTAFYEVTLPTGKATPRGSFSSEHQVVDIAVPLNQL